MQTLVKNHLMTIERMNYPAASSGVSSGVMLHSPQAAGNTTRRDSTGSFRLEKEKEAVKWGWERDLIYKSLVEKHIRKPRIMS